MSTHWKFKLIRHILVRICFKIITADLVKHTVIMDIGIYINHNVFFIVKSQVFSSSLFHIEKPILLGDFFFTFFTLGSPPPPGSNICYKATLLCYRKSRGLGRIKVFDVLPYGSHKKILLSKPRPLSPPPIPQPLRPNSPPPPPPPLELNADKILERLKKSFFS